MSSIRWNVQQVARSKGYDNARRLGLDCGIYPASIVPIWNGTAQQIALRTLEKLCEGLQVPPWELLSFEAASLPQEPDLDWRGLSQADRDAEAAEAKRRREAGEMPPAIAFHGSSA